MTITELMEKLQEMLDKYGDLVVMYDFEGDVCEITEVLHKDNYLTWNYKEYILIF